MFTKTFKPSQKDITLVYFLIGLFITCSCIYISNEYLYSKQSYTYTMSDTDSKVFINNTSEFNITNEVYPCSAQVDISNIMTEKNLSMWDLEQLSIQNLSDVSNEEYLDESELLEPENESTNEIITENYQDWRGVYNWTSHQHTLPTPFGVRTSTFDFINVTNFEGHDRVLELNESSTSNADIYTDLDATLTYPIFYEFYLNIVYLGSTGGFTINCFTGTWCVWSMLIQFNTYNATHYQMQYVKDGNWITTTSTIFVQITKWNRIGFEFINNTFSKLYLNEVFMYNTTHDAGDPKQFYIGSGAKPVHFYIDAIGYSELGYVTGSNDVHYIPYQNIYTLNSSYLVTLNDVSTHPFNLSVNTIFTNTSLVTLGLFNYKTNSYDVISDEYFEDSYSNLYIQNKILNISVFINQSTDFSFDIETQVVVFYYNISSYATLTAENLGFHLLFDFHSTNDIGLELNGVELTSLSFEIEITEETEFEFSCDLLCYFNIVIVKTWDITEIVEDE